MKTYSHRPPTVTVCDHGFASILTVLSTGIALLIMLVVMYQDTVQTQEDQKISMLGGDYQQREDAFLRALVNIVPNQAMRGMQDNSYNAPEREEISWETAITLAYTSANVEKALPTRIAGDLKVENMRNANTANFSESVDITKIISPLNSTDSGDFKSEVGALVSPGTEQYNKAISADYPARLTETKADKTRNAFYPVVSNGKIYDASVDGWIGEKTKDKRFALIPLPKNHFNYKDGAEFIAKNNWWTFKVNFSEQQKGLTKFNTRDKQYIFSIYEIPAQLAINVGSETTLGKHDGGTAWDSAIKVEGGVFASKIKTEGSFSSASIASRKQIELSDTTSIGSSFQQSDIVGNKPEEYESKNQNLLISSAGNSGRVAFIPINGGEFITNQGSYATLADAKNAAFYDNPDLTISTPDPPSNEASDNAISPTSWKYYSRGACQCKMRIVYDSANLHFSFEDDSITDADFTGHADYSKIITRIDDNISIDVKALLELLDLTAGITTLQSNSLYIKGPEDSKVILEHTEDLSLATDGFSIVSNTQLVIASDLNTEGDGVALSLFAPEIQYGKEKFSYEINVTGSLTSTSKSGVSHIADLKSGDENSITSTKISATLQSITTPSKLPPINMMNWMIVVTEKH